jgi:hypothetical protein
MQAAQVVAPSRSGRKHVAASKATPTPTPAQAIPRKPVPTPTTPARRFSYEPVVGNPYADLAQQGDVAPLNLVGLEVAQADTAKYAQPAFQFATGPGAGETARVTATRADAYTRLTGEAAPANLGSPTAPPATSPAATKKTTPRKVVNSTFGDVIDAGMDASWASDPRDGKVSTPTDTPPPQPTNNLQAELNPFAALGSAAQMFKKQGQANQTLPSTSVAPAPTQPAKPLAPKPLATSAWTKTPAQWASEAPPVPGTDFTQDLRDHRASQMMQVTCAKCTKVIPAVAIAGHRCAKPPMTEERKQEVRNMRISKMFPPSQFPSRCVKMGEWAAKAGSSEDEAPEVFLDTYVQAATTVWRSVTRQ